MQLPTSASILALAATQVLVLFGTTSRAGEVSTSRWQIFPPEVVVSADYPAQVVVVEQRADGTSVDRTHDPAIRFEVSGGAPLDCSPDGRIHISQAAPPSTETPSPAKVAIQIADEHCHIPVTVASSHSPSPIFPREISAILGRAGCNLGTCHGNLHGKGGFRLSLRGDDPHLDFASIVRADGGRRIDSFASQMSLLLKKPTGLLAHQGGVRFRDDSIEYRLLQRWISEGCQWHAQDALLSNSNSQDAETLESLSVYPPECLLASDCRSQQLVVIARFGDGAIRDVTPWARFEASSPTGVSISPEGLVTADEAIDVGISVSYLSGRAGARLTFLPEEHSEWNEPPAQSRLDQLADAQLQRMRLTPTRLADDSLFLRRAYLTTVGRLPTAAEARQFISSTAKQAGREGKRERLIESLLHDSGYAMLWALRWSDLLRNEQKVMSPEGAAGWHAWMRTQIAEDRPLTDFVSEMITTIGSTYENPPASFHRSHREPETAAETIGQVFLGVRLQCARCHNHPFDNWRQDDYYGLAAYFTNIGRKQIDNQPRDKFDKHIISGDEIISLAGGPSQIRHPGRAADVPPKPLTEVYQPGGGSSESQGDENASNPLEALAEWLTQDNRMFARNMANRIWYHVMGRGIVDPPDDFRDSNPPSNPELLEYLTDELIRHDYSVRHLTRLILNSRTFAREAVEDIRTGEGLDAEALFAGYPLRRMSAEVLLDAISDVTQVYEVGGETPVTDVRYVAKAEVPSRAGFLTTFGKPDRLLVCECERSNAVSLGQSLVMVNGEEVREKLSESNNRLDRIFEHHEELPAAIEELYLASLTRFPTSMESHAMVDYVKSQGDRRQALEDVLWALLNSKEFALVR